MQLTYVGSQTEPVLPGAFETVSGSTGDEIGAEGTSEPAFRVKL